MIDKLAVAYGKKLRDEKWELYCRFFPPKMYERVLDVGTSEMDHLPNENYFLRKYPFPRQLTAVGVNDLAPLRAIYPDVTFLQADGRDLPFADQTFDVVHSNAVIEHVGPAPEQRRFAAELTRVAREGVVTTPNRWFPVESHTRLPLVHWLPRPLMIRSFELCRRAERGFWLLSSRRFRRLFPADVDLCVVANRIAGWPATISIVFVRR